MGSQSPEDGTGLQTVGVGLRFADEGNGEMHMDVKKLYEERLQRFDDVMCRRRPDRVPIIPNMGTWMYFNAGVSVRRAFLEDPNEIVRAAKHLADRVPMDALMSTSNTIPIAMAQNLGEGAYVVSENGVQIRGSSGQLMAPQEYGLLAENPLKFFANVLIPRKFACFQGASLEKKVDMIKRAYADYGAYLRYNRAADVRIEELLGLPHFCRGTNFLSPDVVLDYLRDFVGISLDVRRRSDELLAACESLYDFILEMFFETATPPDRKAVFSPLHLPTYLRPRDFAKLYLPFMRRYIEELSVKRGYTVYFFMENDWMPYLDLLEELPRNAKFVGLFEAGDLSKIKARLGDRIIVMGGMPVSLLGFGTKQEVIDKAKACLDTLAPGGGYIFSTDKTLLNLGDCKEENLIAACEYIEAYGRY